MKKLILALLFLVAPCLAMDENHLKAELSQYQLNVGLVSASFKGECERVKKLLALGAQPNPAERPWYYDRDWPALSAAAYAKHEDICKMLLEHGADVHATDFMGKTPLMYAAECCGEEEYDPNTPTAICTLLIEHGANVNTQNIAGSSALMDAASARDEKACQFLIQQGAIDDKATLIAQTRAMPKKKLTPHQEKWLSVELKDNAGRGKAFEVELLLAIGAHQCQNGASGTIAMLDAVLNNRLSMCQSFIEHGVNPNSAPWGYETALILAARYGYIELFQLFMAHGADLTLKINGPNKHGDLALRQVTCWGMKNHLAICKSLLDHGANPNALIERETALTSAVGHNSGPEVRRLLLEYGADLTIKNEDGDTALAKHWDNTYITHSRFPACSSEDLKESQQRTRFLLCLMKRICATLPKDMKEFILLSSGPTVWQDACRTPLRLHEKKYDHLKLMPPQVVQVLIRHKALELDQTVSILTAHKFEQLKPLMIHAANRSSNSHLRRDLMNPDLLERNFGDEIVEIITLNCLAGGDKTEKIESK